MAPPAEWPAHGDITAKVPAPFRTTFLGLARTAQRFQPGDPMAPPNPITPSNVRLFVPSVTLLRALRIAVVLSDTGQTRA